MLLSFNYIQGDTTMHNNVKENAIQCNNISAYKLNLDKVMYKEYTENPTTRVHAVCTDYEWHRVCLISTRKDNVSY